VSLWVHHSCCMQIFRSIDTESCVGFPTTNAEAYDRGLISSALPCRLSLRTCQKSLKPAVRQPYVK